eukprot:4221788-Pyramimonas_sp.AAC.1
MDLSFGRFRLQPPEKSWQGLGHLENQVLQWAPKLEPPRKDKGPSVDISAHATSYATTPVYLHRRGSGLNLVTARSAADS